MAQEGMKRPLCGGDLCWDNDFDASDVHGREEDDGGIVSYYHCMNCGRGYEITDPEKDERETTYKKYWHG